MIASYKNSPSVHVACIRWANSFASGLRQATSRASSRFLPAYSMWKPTCDIRSICPGLVAIVERSLTSPKLFAV